MFRIGNKKQCRFILFSFFDLWPFPGVPPSWLPSIRVFTVLSVGTLVVTKPISFFCRFCSPVALRYLVLTKLNSKLVTSARLTLSPTFPYPFQNNITRKVPFTAYNKTFLDFCFFCWGSFKRTLSRDFLCLFSSLFEHNSTRVLIHFECGFKLWMQKFLTVANSSELNSLPWQIAQNLIPCCGH